MAIKDLRYVDNLAANKLQMEKDRQMAETLQMLARAGLQGLGVMGVQEPKNKVAGVDSIALPNQIDM